MDYILKSTRLYDMHQSLTKIRTLPYPLSDRYKVKVTEISNVCLNPILTLH